MAADDAYAAVARLQADLRQLQERYAASQSEAASLRAENRELTTAYDEARAQQTATTEILRVIASSPADPTTVLDAIAP